MINLDLGRYAEIWVLAGQTSFEINNEDIFRNGPEEVARLKTLLDDLHEEGKELGEKLSEKLEKFDKGNAAISTLNSLNNVVSQLDCFKSVKHVQLPDWS